MTRRYDNGRPTSWIGKRLPKANFADPVSSAKAIRAVLPDAIAHAEAAGFAIIASHLGKALRMAERISVKPVSPQEDE